MTQQYCIVLQLLIPSFDFNSYFGFHCVKRQDIFIQHTRPQCVTRVDSRQIVIHDLYPRLNYGALIFWPFLSATATHATVASRRLHHLYVCVISNSTAELMIYLMHPLCFTVRNLVGMSSRTRIFLEVAVLICKNRIYFVFYQKKILF